MLICGVLCITALIFFDLQIHPIIKNLSVSTAKFVSVQAINTAVSRTLADEGSSYGKMVHITNDAQGVITSIQADSGEMNRMKSELTQAIQQKIKSADVSEMKIPLGSVFGGDFLMGRGPRISVKIDLAGNVFTQLYSVFEAAGINQTHHKIMLNVKCSVLVMMTGYTTSTEIDTDFCIAETVIVGKIPDAYTNVQTNGSNIPEKINDYGAVSQK